MHADNRKKGILTLDEGPMQGLDDTSLTAEAEYFIFFSEKQNKFCLILHYS